MSTAIRPAPVFLSPAMEPYQKWRLSTYNQLKAEILAEISGHEATIAGGGDIRADLIQSLIDGLCGNLQWLETMHSRGVFVDDTLCNANGFALDYHEYHVDRADRCYAVIDQMKSLEALTETEDQRRQIAESIAEQSRFAEAHLAKANVPGFKVKAKRLYSSKELNAIKQFIDSVETRK